MLPHPSTSVVLSSCWVLFGNLCIMFRGFLRCLGRAEFWVPVYDLFAPVCPAFCSRLLASCCWVTARTAAALSHNLFVFRTPGDCNHDRWAHLLFILPVCGPGKWGVLSSVRTSFHVWWANSPDSIKPSAREVQSNPGKQWAFLRPNCFFPRCRGKSTLDWNAVLHNRDWCGACSDSDVS